MSGHPYQYKVLVEYVSPQQAGKYPHFSHMEDQAGLEATLGTVFEHMPESIPDGWDVVSHNIAVSRSTLIVTVLLRRGVR